MNWPTVPSPFASAAQSRYRLKVKTLKKADWMNPEGWYTVRVDSHKREKQMSPWSTDWWMRTKKPQITFWFRKENGE